MSRHVTMTWAQRLKRVFHIDIETCDHYGGAVKIIADRIEARAAGHGWPVCGYACIEDPAVIKTTAWMQEVEQRMEQLPKILDHLKATISADTPMRPESRAPPRDVLFH